MIFYWLTWPNHHHYSLTIACSTAIIVQHIKQLSRKHDIQMSHNSNIYFHINAIIEKKNKYISKLKTFFKSLWNRYLCTILGLLAIRRNWYLLTHFCLRIKKRILLKKKMNKNNEVEIGRGIVWFLLFWSSNKLAFCVA